MATASTENKNSVGQRKLFTHSHAEAALARRVDVHVTDNFKVVKSLVKRGRKSVRGSDGLGKGSLLMRNGCLHETCGGTEYSKKEDREEGTSHGEGRLLVVVVKAR